MADPSISGEARMGASGNGHVPHESPADAMKDLSRQVGELRSHLAYFVSAKLDGVKVSVRNAGIYAALGIIGLIGIGGMVVTAVVLLLGGLAGAVSAMFGASVWLGELLVGVLVLALIGVGTWLGLSRLTKRFRENMVDKYERKCNEQRSEFGHDVHDRAAAGG